MKRTIVGLAVASAILSAAAPASARIVEGQSIAGIKLGATQAQVRAKLGTAKEALHCGRGCVTWKYDAPFSGVVAFKGSTVSGMWTDSPKQKTSKGVGTGSSEAAVQRAYPKAKCGPGPLGPDSRTCTIKGRYRGRTTITLFAFNTRGSGAREVDVYFATPADLS